MAKFIGRQEELNALAQLLGKKSASFVVIRGRRRIGKSRLIDEFGKELPCYLFSGLPPKPQASRQEQIDLFLDQMSRQFGIPRLQATNWGEVFWLLGQQCKQGRLILALDEISWMGSKDSNFMGELKNAWDLYFSKNPELVLIVCGSVSSWIQDNILSHTGFVGRISLDLCLRELPLKDAVKFFNSHRDRLSSYEIFKILSVTGGVPRYLEEVQLALRAEENIRQLCFTERGLLFREYEQIFSDLFFAKAPRYTEILENLCGGPRSVNEIAKALNLSRGGRVSEYLRVLLQAGFIAEHPAWSLQSIKSSRLKKFRLSDNYLRFYLRCIRPQRERVLEGLFKNDSMVNLPGWDSILGLQFENMVLNNTLELLPRLGIAPSDVLRLGPFFQRKTARQPGCQIDLLIQLRYRTLFLCEIKYSIDPVGMTVVDQVRQKQERIVIPKGWSVRPVLVHVGGCTRQVKQSGAFDHIIDFSELLN